MRKWGILLILTILATATYAQCGENEYYDQSFGENYGLCKCLKGYTRQNGECVPETQCGENEYYSYGQCLCKQGYHNVEGQCMKIEDDYEEYDDTDNYDEQECGPNAYMTSQGCKCNIGYTIYTQSIGCEKIYCGENGHLIPGTNECECNTGYTVNSQGYCEKIQSQQNTNQQTYQKNYNPDIQVIPADQGIETRTDTTGMDYGDIRVIKKGEKPITSEQEKKLLEEHKKRIEEQYKQMYPQDNKKEESNTQTEKPRRITGDPIKDCNSLKTSTERANCFAEKIDPVILMKGVEITKDLDHSEVVSAWKTHQTIQRIKETNGMTTETPPLTEALTKYNKATQQLTPQENKIITTFNNMLELSNSANEKTGEILENVDTFFEKKKEFQIRFDKRTEQKLSEIKEKTDSVKEKYDKANRVKTLLTGNLQEKAEAAEEMLEEYKEKYKDTATGEMIEYYLEKTGKIKKFGDKVSDVKEKIETAVNTANEWNENSQKLPGGAGWTANGLNLFSKGAEYIADKLKKTPGLQPAGDMVEFYGTAATKPVQVIAELHQERMTHLEETDSDLQTTPYASEISIFLRRNTEQRKEQIGNVESQRSVLTYEMDGEQKKFEYNTNLLKFVKEPGTDFIVPIIDGDPSRKIQGDLKFKVKHRTTWQMLWGDCNKMEYYTTEIPPRKIGEGCI